MKTLTLKDVANYLMKAGFGIAKEGLPDEQAPDIAGSCEREGVDNRAFLESFSNLQEAIIENTSDLVSIRELASACQVTDETLLDVVSVQYTREISRIEADLAEASARADLLPIVLESRKLPPIMRKGDEHIKMQNGAIYYEGDEFEGKLTIPDIFEGERVCSIGAIRCKKVTSIDLPSSVTTVFPEAFMGCEALRTIVLPETIVSIGTRAFMDCKSLESVVLPSGIRVIESETFSGCRFLKTVILPKELIAIGSSAFSNCEHLKTVRFHKRLERIGPGAFSNCCLLTEVDLTENEDLIHIEQRCFEDCASLERVGLPSSIETIGAYAFYLCTSLKYFCLPENLVSIGESAFFKCEKWECELEIPQSVINLGDLCFCSCSSITKVTVPSCPVIPHQAFDECKHIREVVLGKATEIGPWAFSCCYDLEKVTLPSYVQCIDEDAFEDCFNLKSIVLVKTKPDIPKNAFPEGLEWNH